MGSIKLNAEQRKAMDRFKQAADDLIESGVVLIAADDDGGHDLVALKAYSCWDIDGGTVTIDNQHPGEIDESDKDMVDVTDDMETVYIGIDDILREEGYRAYAKFRK